MPTSIDATGANVILGSTSLHTPCQVLRLICASSAAPFHAAVHAANAAGAERL